VDDARLVNRRKAGGDLDCDFAQQRFGNGAEVAQELAKAAALDVLHRHVVDLLVFDERRIDLVGTHDVGVMDALADFPLLQEPLEESRRRQQVRVDDLERDALADSEQRCRLDDFGEIDRSHPARAELGFDAIRSDSASNHACISMGSGQAGEGAVEYPDPAPIRPRLHGDSRRWMGQAASTRRGRDRPPAPPHFLFGLPCVGDTASYIVKRLLALALLTACAAPVARYPVDTEIAFAPLRSTVDSELAARYLSGDPDSLLRIAAIEQKYDERALGNDQLRALADETSTDFAAVYFARRILSVPRHGEMQKRFAETLKRLATSKPTRIDELDRDIYTFAFVPGLFYDSRPENGAAMTVTRDVLDARGFTTYLVPTGETSSVEQGARVLADYLLKARKSGRKIILTSASKGGADVAYALGHLLAGENLDHVHGWVSIGGVLRGTPLADVGLTFPSNLLLALTGWAHGTSLAVARDLSTAVGIPRAESCQLPEHLQVLHYIGVPLSGTVSPEVRGDYDLMRPFGPNDGVTLLADEILPQGHVVLAIGADHHFDDPRTDLKTLALASLMVELVDLRR